MKKTIDDQLDHITVKKPLTDYHKQVILRAMERHIGYVNLFRAIQNGIVTGFEGITQYQIRNAYEKAKNGR